MAKQQQTQTTTINVFTSTRDEVLQNVTEQVIANYSPAHHPSPSQIKSEILTQTHILFSQHNSNKGAVRWREPTELEAIQIATVLAKCYYIRRINTTGDSALEDYDTLAIYQTDGQDKGTYMCDSQTFAKLIMQYRYTLNPKMIDEVMSLLMYLCPRMTRCDDPDLIAVNNGIFNYKTKTLSEFSPDIVFMVKCHVDYRPNAQEPILTDPDDGYTWNVESWIKELMGGDKDLSKLIWEVMGAILRPNVRWNKMAMFYSVSGNSGKGTLCELMRQLVGEKACCSIPLADFDKQFMLEPLMYSQAIITDENSVGAYLDEMKNLKAILTQDIISINRKYKTPINYRFRGFCVQCVNDLPKARDKSDSLYRRILVIPFDQCYTGKERTYIKNEYIKRQDVLEYILCKLLNSNYYALSNPERCQGMLDEYKVLNDPVRQFLGEILPICKWDLLPYSFLYDLYKSWFAKNLPSGTVSGNKTFIQDVKSVLKDFPDWIYNVDNHPYSANGRIYGEEPLIIEYDLKSWMEPTHRLPKNPTHADEVAAATPLTFLSASYRGILRRSSAGKTVSSIRKENRANAAASKQ